MKIVCDNCGAKYQISDEKVRNKVFKIRCKKCSHVIVVRAGASGRESAPAPGAEQGAEEPTRVVGQSAPAEAPAGDAIWYVVVNREQVGPLTPAEVERRFRAGEIDAETFTWAEGMSDWVRLAAVTEFAHLFEAAEPRPAAIGAEPSASVFSSAEEGDEDVMVSRNESASESLFGSAAAEEPASPRVGGQQLLHQRNENSVLFSLDSLASDVEARGSARPAVASTGGSEGSGLIDISALLGPGPAADAQGGDDAFGGGGPAPLAPAAPAPAGVAPIPALVTRRRGNTGAIVAAIVVGGLLVGGGVFAAMVYLSKDKANDERPVVTANDEAGAQEPVKVPVGGPPAAPAGEKGAAAAEGESEKAAANAEPPKADDAPKAVADDEPNERAAANDEDDRSERRAGGARRAEKRDRPRPTAVSRRDRERERKGSRVEPEDQPRPRAEVTRATERPKPEPRRPERRAPKKGGDDIDSLLSNLDGKKSGRPAARSAAAPAAKAAPSGADNPLLPEQLSRNDILMVVRRKTPAVLRCKERQPDASGTVTVRLTIGRNGRVNDARIVSGNFRGSPVGNCVESVARTFQFPQFRGDPMTINLPFRL